MNNIKTNKFSYWISIFVIAVGVMVMLGWNFDITVLKSLVPGFATMKFNTALGFVMAGTAFLMFLNNTNRFLYKGVAFVLVILATATITEVIFNVDLGIDQFFFTEQGVIKTSHESPGRPSAVTSFCFLLIGLVFLIIDTKNVLIKRIILSVLNFITVVSFIAIIGYCFGVPAFYKHSFFASMAIHTTVLFLLLSLGIGFIFADMGLINLFLSKGLGGVMMRKLFPRLVVFILILGFIRMKIYQHSYVSVQFGTALFTTVFLVMTTYLLYSTGKMLDQIDRKRRKAENRIILANRNLEKTVKQRTDYLVRQNKQLEDFANIISHNLRGSVGNLGSLLNFYKEEPAADEKEDLINKFEITVANIESTLNDLLELVQIKHDVQKTKELVSFESVFAKVRQTFEGKIMEANAEIIVDFSKAPQLMYSAVYLESIMQNMLSNALKYHSPKRTPVIRFETMKSDKGVVLKISDNGLGIDLDRYGSKIFGLNKVFHNHPEAKGIGLFMTKAQIEGMGGEISVESKVDKGTTFRIFFDLNAADV